MKPKKDGFKCCICGKWTSGWGDHHQYGNNPYPIYQTGQCCNECNILVIQVRLDQYKERNIVKKEDLK